MTIARDFPSSLLGHELAEALRRSLETTLESRTALRQAVRRYAINKRQSGMTLNELRDAAATILSEAENEKADRTSGPPFRDAELAMHLRKWCEDDFFSY